jgi:hypothetical protein
VPGNLITLIAAIAIVALVATLLMRAVKTSAATALKIAAIVAIVLVLQLGFSIRPEAIWLQIRELLQLARDGLSELGPGWWQ